MRGNEEIFNRFTGAVIIPAGKYASLKEAVEKEYSSLSGADFSGANLSRASLSGANLSGASLSWANLSGANLSRASLSWANISWANLSGANLSGANLSGASLSWANLSGANLSWADLSGADLKKIPQLNNLTVNEYIDKLKIEKDGEFVYFYKAVTLDLLSPQSNVKIKYTKGVHAVEFADCDVWQDCSCGLSVSPTEAAARKFGEKILKVKVNIGDIVCIPVYGHDEKIRVKKLEVL